MLDTLLLSMFITAKEIAVDKSWLINRSDLI